MSAAATEADIPPLLTEIKNEGTEGEQNAGDEATIDSISKLAHGIKIQANEPFTFEGDNFLITPSVCEVQSETEDSKVAVKPDQAAVDDPKILVGNLKLSNDQTLELVSDQECNNQNVQVNRGHDETEDAVSKGECTSNQNKTTSGQEQVDNDGNLETVENASDNSREDKVTEKSAEEFELTQVVDGSHDERDQQLEKENEVSTGSIDGNESSLISDIRDEDKDLKKVVQFETETNTSTKEDISVEKTIESLHAAPTSGHDNKATSSPEEQIIGADTQGVKNEDTEEKIMDDHTPQELQQHVAVSDIKEDNDNDSLSQVEAHLEKEEISSDKTRKEIAKVAGTKEEFTEDAVTCVVNQDSLIAEDGSQKPSEKQVSTSKDSDHDSANALDEKFEDENSQKAELVETEKCTEKEMEISLMEASNEKEIPTEDVHEISIDKKKEEFDNVADTKDITTIVSIQKEVSTSKPSDDEQPTKTLEDESSLKAKSVEKQKCTEALSEKEIQTIESEETREEITEVADIRNERAKAEIEDESSLKATKKEMEISREVLIEKEVSTCKASDAHEPEITLDAKIEDESSPTVDSTENEKCIDREMEVSSMDASSEKEIPTTNPQEISSDTTMEERDGVPDSTEENIKDVAMNIPNRENRGTPPVAEDETEISACKVAENEATNTVEAKFENESSLKAEMLKNKECTEKIMDISVTEEASSEQEIQTADSHEISSDKAKEEIDEVVDDITTNFPNQENEEVSTFKDRENEQPTNTFEEESSLKAELVEKEKCTKKEMEISSTEVSSEKEIETIESDKTKEEITEVADEGEESTKDVETNFPDQEKRDISAIEDGSQKTEKEVSACKASDDHEPTNTLEAKIEDENSTKAELVENEKCTEKEMEISSTKVSTEKEIPTENPQEISTDVTKEESDEVAGSTEESTKDIATDDVNQKNEDTSQDDASQKPSHREVSTAKVSDNDSENLFDAKFEDENFLKRELIENKKCTEKEMEVLLTEASSEKEIPTTDVQEISSGKTEEEIFEVVDTKDITMHVLDQEKEDTSLAAEDDLQNPSQNEISTSKATYHEPRNTFEDESSLKAELVEKEKCTEKDMEISSSKVSSEKEIQTTRSDKTKEKTTEAADIREDSNEAKIEESSLKVEQIENEKCTDKDMEISSTEASSEEEIPTTNPQEISSDATKEESDEVADSKEESIKGEAVNIFNQENEDTSPIVEDGKEVSMRTVNEKAENTLQAKFEDKTSLKAEEAKNAECTEKTTEILPIEASSEKEIQTVDFPKISSDKIKEEIDEVADTKEESTEDLLAEEGLQKPSQKEVLTSEVHDQEPTNKHESQLDDESSLNAEQIENEKCTKEEMDKPSTEASGEKQIQTADPQEASSDKTKEEIDEVADLKEERIKDVAVTVPNQENEGTTLIAEESSKTPHLKEVSTCTVRDNTVGNAITDKYEDESSAKPELVEKEKSTEKVLVEEETPVESAYAADEDIKPLDSRPDKETSFLEEEKVIEQHTEDKAHNAATGMVETCENEDAETDITHENANEKPPTQVHSSWMETETSTRETISSTSVTEGAQVDINEEKTTEENVEGEKGIVSSDKDNAQISSFKDDSEKLSLEEASAGNTDEDKSTVVQDAKHAEENTTEHALSKDEKDVECTLGKEEFSIEPLQVASKDIEAIDTVKETETEKNYLEEQSVATNTQGIISEPEEDKIINASDLNAETPDVDIQGHKKDKSMHTSDPNAEAPEEKDVVPTVTHEDMEESFPTQVDAVETSKEPETKSVEEQKLTSNLQEISIAKTKEETSDTKLMNKETLDKQEAKFEDKETITAKFNERSIDETLATEEEPVESLQVAVKDVVECVSGQESEKSHSPQEEILKAIYDNKEDEKTNKMDSTIETPDAENIAANNHEKSSIVPDAEYVEHDLSTHEKDIECMSGKEEVSLEPLKVAGEDIKAVDSVKETDVNYLEEQGKATTTRGIIRGLEENKIIGVSDLNAETPENKDVATTVTHKDAEESLPTELDAKQNTHLEKVTENSSNVQILTQYTTESTLVKEESQVKDIKLSTPCQEPEAKSAEEQIITSNPQEIPIAKTEEEIFNTKSMTREALDEQETKFEDKDTITAKFKERSIDEALATEEESFESLQVSAKDVVAYDAGQESGNSSSLQEEILEANHEKFIYDNKEDEKTDKVDSTIETPDTEVRKDVATILQEVTCETSIPQMDLSQKEPENLSFTELPKEDTIMLKEEAEVQCRDSLQDKETNPIKDQISDAESPNIWHAITEEKTIIHKAHTLEEGLEVKDNIMEKTDHKVSEVAENTSEKCNEQLEEDDTTKSFLKDEMHAGSGLHERECKQDKILLDETKDVQESTATLVASDSNFGKELTIDREEPHAATTGGNEHIKNDEDGDKGDESSGKILDFSHTPLNTTEARDQDLTRSDALEGEPTLNISREGQELETINIEKTSALLSQHERDELDHPSIGSTIEDTSDSNEVECVQTENKCNSEHVKQEPENSLEIQSCDMILKAGEAKTDEDKLEAAAEIHSDQALAGDILGKKQNEGEDEDMEHHRLGYCKEEITAEKQLVEEAKQETFKNIDNVNETEKIPKVYEGGAGENAREPQEDLPANESLDRSLHQNQEEKNIEEVRATVETEDSNQADHSYAEIRTEDSIKNEETNMGEICETKKDVDITEKVSKVMEEAVKEPEEHSLAKEPNDESLDQEQLGKDAVQVASILDAEEAYGTDNLHVKTNQEALNTEDMSEVKENENEMEKDSNVFEAAVENAQDKNIKEVTTIVDSEEVRQVNHVNIERKFEDSREVTAKDEVMQEEIKTGEICKARDLEIETEKEPKVSEEVIQDPEEHIEAYESIDKNAAQRELEKSIKEHVEVEEARGMDHVHTETKIEEPRDEIITESCPEHEVKQQEIIEKEICEIKKTADETMEEPKTIEEAAMQEPEENLKTDKSFDRSQHEGNQQQINEKEICEVQTFPDKSSKVAFQGVAETAMQESEKNVHANVTESLQQKEPGKCVEQVSEVSQELEEKFPTNINRSLPQEEHDESVEEVAPILDTKEVSHEAVNVHIEARGGDLEEKEKAESHPEDNETKNVSSDFEKVDGKAVQALEETQMRIELVTTTLDTSETGFEESREENGLETVAEKDVEQLGKGAEVATATLDAEKFNENKICKPAPTQPVYETIEHSENKKENSDAIKEEKCHKRAQKDSICSSNEVEVKEEEYPMLTETKGEAEDKKTFNNKEESANNSESKETEKPSLSALFQASARETVQTADDDQSHEEKVSDEESNEKRGSDIIPYEAPVMVDATAVAGDTEVKSAHKKSHNILSGVGSKVKHSISKVKKAITGKSSHHPKPSSPN